MVGRCGPWDMTWETKNKRTFAPPNSTFLEALQAFPNPDTAVEALQRALLFGTSENWSGIMWETDATLADDQCVIEVHPKTFFELQMQQRKQQ
jgi:hypothetical protein